MLSLPSAVALGSARSLICTAPMLETTSLERLPALGIAWFENYENKAQVPYDMQEVRAASSESSRPKVK